MHNGDRPVTISGTTISVGTAGILVADPSGSRTIPFSSGLPYSVTQVAGQAITIGPGSVIISPGTTLRAGDAPLTMDGTTLSVGTAGITVIDPTRGTQTIQFPSASPSASILQIGGQAVTVGGGSIVLGLGTTLHVGDAPLTINGTAVSVGTSGIVIVDPGHRTQTVSVNGGSEQTTQSIAGFNSAGSATIVSRWLLGSVMFAVLVASLR